MQEKPANTPSVELTTADINGSKNPVIVELRERNHVLLQVAGVIPENKEEKNSSPSAQRMSDNFLRNYAEGSITVAGGSLGLSDIRYLYYNNNKKLATEWLMLAIQTQLGLSKEDKVLAELIVLGFSQKVFDDILGNLRSALQKKGQMMGEPEVSMDVRKEEDGIIRLYCNIPSVPFTNSIRIEGYHIIDGDIRLVFTITPGGYFLDTDKSTAGGYLAKWLMDGVFPSGPEIPTDYSKTPASPVVGTSVPKSPPSTPSVEEKDIPADIRKLLSLAKTGSPAARPTNIKAISTLLMQIITRELTSYKGKAKQVIGKPREEHLIKADNLLNRLKELNVPRTKLLQVLLQYELEERWAVLQSLEGHHYFSYADISSAIKSHCNVQADGKNQFEAIMGELTSYILEKSSLPAGIISPALAQEDPQDSLGYIREILFVLNQVEYAPEAEGGYVKLYKKMLGWVNHLNDEISHILKLKSQGDSKEEKSSPIALQGIFSQKKSGSFNERLNAELVILCGLKRELRAVYLELYVDEPKIYPGLANPGLLTLNQLSTFLSAHAPVFSMGGRKTPAETGYELAQVLIEQARNNIASLAQTASDPSVTSRGQIPAGPSVTVPPSDSLFSSSQTFYHHSASPEPGYPKQLSDEAEGAVEMTSKN